MLKSNIRGLLSLFYESSQINVSKSWIDRSYEKISRLVKVPISVNEKVSSKISDRTEYRTKSAIIYESRIISTIELKYRYYISDDNETSYLISRFIFEELSKYKKSSNDSRLLLRFLKIFSIPVYFAIENESHYCIVGLTKLILTAISAAIGIAYVYFK